MDEVTLSTRPGARCAIKLGVQMLVRQTRTCRQAGGDLRRRRRLARQVVRRLSLDRYTRIQPGTVSADSEPA